MNSLIIISAAWVVFYSSHSVLALRQVKDWGERLSGSRKRYRLVYVLISTVFLALVAYLLLIMETEVLFERTDAHVYASLMITTLGIIIIQRSFRNISSQAFLGLREESDTQLITRGIYGYVRHPLYAGTILIFVGAVLFIPTYTMLVSLVWLLIYLPVGIYLEELKLVGVFGEEYLQYKRDVKALIPWVI